MPGTLELLGRLGGRRVHGGRHNYRHPPNHRHGPLQQQQRTTTRPPGSRLAAILTFSNVFRLARVFAMVVLLGLAAGLKSPLYAGHKQTQPSATCPRPQLFESWVAVSVVVVVAYISSSAWTKVRKAGGRPRTPPPTDPESQRTTPPTAAPPAAPLHRVRSAPDAVPPPPPTAVARTPLSQSSPTVSLYCAPTAAGAGVGATAAVSSSSTTNLPAASSSSTPSTPEASAASASTSALASTYSFGSLGALQKVPEGETMQQHLPSLPIGALPPVLLSNPLSSSSSSNNTSTGNNNSSSGNRPRPDSTVIPESRAQSRMSRGPYPVPYLTTAERRAVHRAEIARKIDSAASRSGLLMLPRVVLFILGNLLILKPFPGNNTTCYQSAPMLWWAVFVGLLDDWIRVIASIVFSATFIVVFLGHGVLLAYDLFAIRMGWRPPHPVVTNTPAPQPLSAADLLRCKTVCFVPDPTDPASDDGHSVVDGEAVAPDEIDRSRLPLPAVVLAAHRAVCGVCQENFTPPREVARIMYKVAELRQLPCEHVFHKACVDEWLLNHSDACPYCQQSVRDGLEKAEVAMSAAVSRVTFPPPAAGSSSTANLQAGSRQSLRVASRGSTHAAHASHGSLGHYPSAAASSSRVGSPPTAARSMSRTSVHQPSMSQVSLGRQPSRVQRRSIQYPAGTRTSVQVRAVSRASVSSNPAASQVSLGHYPPQPYSAYPAGYPPGTYPPAAGSRASLVYGQHPHHHYSRQSLHRTASSASLGFYPPSTTILQLQMDQAGSGASLAPAAGASTTSLFQPAASAVSLATPASRRSSHSRTRSASAQTPGDPGSCISLGVDSSLSRSASASRVSLTQSSVPGAASSGSLVTVPAAVSRAARASLAELAELESAALRDTATPSTRGPGVIGAAI